MTGPQNRWIVRNRSVIGRSDIKARFIRHQTNIRKSPVKVDVNGRFEFPKLIHNPSGREMDPLRATFGKRIHGTVKHIRVEGDNTHSGASNHRFA